MNKSMVIKMMVLGMALSATSVFAHEAKHEGRHGKNGIEKRVAHQEQRIDRKLSKGKMTPDQAQAEKQKVEAVLTERDGMVKQNGGKPLTKVQRKQLNQELNQINKEIEAAGAGSKSSGPVATKNK